MNFLVFICSFRWLCSSNLTQSVTNPPLIPPSTLAYSILFLFLSFCTWYWDINLTPAVKEKLSFVESIVSSFRILACVLLYAYSLLTNLFNSWCLSITLSTLIRILYLLPNLLVLFESIRSSLLSTYFVLPSCLYHDIYLRNLFNVLFFISFHFIKFALFHLIFNFCLLYINWIILHCFNPWKLFSESSTWTFLKFKDLS